MHETNANADVKINDHQIQIEQGDTLYKIAQDNGTDVNTLAQVNHLENPNLIIAGSILNLTDDSTPQQTAPVQNTSVAQSQTTQNMPTQNTPAQAPVQQTAPAVAQTNQPQSNSYTSQVSGSEAAAKAWIAARESGGNYNATNGQYIGKYQLSSSYLNGDYSPANQEQAADNYVHQRYGSWSAAQQFWQANGWY